MKFAIPEISWHNRDPVLSVDFQPKSEIGVPMRLASGGTDSHVLIWYISSKEDGSVKLEVAADLTRHQKAVNIVRWSPNGQLLGSGDDESIIFIWKQKTEEPPIANLEGEEQYKESWVIYKTLRGHMEDVMDISWSSNSLQLASGSVDNKLIVWDINKGKYSSIISDHKGFVQGVSWDPKGQMIASSSSDRVFRTFDIKTKKVISRSHKASLPFPSEHPFHGVKVRLYHDDTLQTYYRRLHFSPDGMLIAVPAGRVEPEQGKIDMKPINAVYIYTRFSLKVPVSILPCGEAALVTRWCPRLYALRPDGPPPAFPLKHRMIFAVGTKRSVLLYDTQQKTPIALITNIHYTRLTDLSWSPDGRSLVASSTDGFCSLISFSAAELGAVLPDEEPAAEEQMDVESEEPTPLAESKPEETEEKKASRPSSPTAFNPSTPAATNPSTPAATNPSTPAASNPSTPAATNPSTPPATNPSTPAATNPSTPAATNPSTPAATNPSTPSASRPSTSAASNPSTPKASNPSTPKASKLSTPKASKPSTPKVSKQSTPKASKPTTPSSSKIDSYLKFKTPTDKSPKKQKLVTVKQKTPIKSDLHEESAMPSWNDNSNSEIVKPTAAVEPEIMEIDDDSADIRLVYEDTQSQSPQNAVPVVPKDSNQETQKDENATEAQASDEVKSPVPSASKPVSPARTNEENFLKQAKVTDMKEHVTVKTVASPKAPRRVNFVTLSSPKNSYKK